MRRHSVRRVIGTRILTLAFMVSYCLGAESHDYALTPQALSAGGISTGGVVSCVGSLGGIVGVSVSPFRDTARQGFVAQLYEVESLDIRAIPDPVDEGATAQSTAAGILDDESVLPLAAAEAVWSVRGWPLMSVTPDGIVQAAAVYAHTSGVLQAEFAGTTGLLVLAVNDVDKDNFSTYAADGIDDDWQVTFFGVDNTNAAPVVDADGDGQDNELEFYALTDPLAATSSLAFRIKTVSPAAGRCDLLIHPRHAERTYVVLGGTNLPGTQGWRIVEGIVDDQGLRRRLTDTNAIETCKYYRLWISRP